MQNDGTSILDKLNTQNTQGYLDNTQQTANATQPSQSEPILTADQWQQQKAKTQPQQAQPDANANGTTNNGDGGNFFTKALPTLGSIAAPIIGALLAPETGGASLLAGLALASGGSGAGKLAENAIEGNKDLGSGVADSAVSGGVGQLAGGAIGKVLGGVAKGVGGMAEKGIAAKAAEKQGIDAVENQQALNNTYGGLSTKFKQNNNFDDNIKLAQSLGVDHLNPQALSDTSNQAGDIYNGVINSALTNAGGVDTNGLTDILKSAINKNAGTLGSIEPVALKKGLVGPASNPASKLYQQLQGQMGGLFNQSAADPIALREAISKVGSLVGDAKPAISASTGAIDPAQRATYNTLGDVYGQLKDLLYNRPEVTSQIKDLTGNILPEDVGGNPALASHLNGVLTNAQTPQDVIDSLKQFSQMGSIGKEASSLAQDSARPANLNAVKQDVPELSTASPAIPTSKTGIVAGLANNVLGAVGNGGATSQVAAKLADTLTNASRVAPNTTNAGLIGTLGAQTVAGAPNFQQPAGGNNAVQDIALPQMTGQLSDIMHSTNEGSLGAKAALLNMMFGALGADHTGDASIIKDYAGHQQDVQNSDAQLNSYIHALNAAGGGQGMIPGLLAQLGGAITGGPAHAAELQRAQLEASLARTLGHPISLPGLTSTTGSANSILGQLGTQLQTAGGV